MVAKTTSKRRNWSESQWVFGLSLMRPDLGHNVNMNCCRNCSPGYYLSRLSHTPAASSSGAGQAPQSSGAGPAAPQSSGAGPAPPSSGAGPAAHQSSGAGPAHPSQVVNRHFVNKSGVHR
jgi:hypothetical protein